MSGHIVDKSSLCAKDVFLPVRILSYFNKIRIKQKFGPEFENGYLCWSLALTLQYWNSHYFAWLGTHESSDAALHILSCLTILGTYAFTRISAPTISPNSIDSSTTCCRWLTKCGWRQQPASKGSLHVVTVTFFCNYMQGIALANTADITFPPWTLEVGAQWGTGSQDCHPHTPCLPQTEGIWLQNFHQHTPGLRCWGNMKLCYLLQ